MREKSKFIDITGQKFNELTAIRCINSKKRMWEWQCSCGKICIARKNDVVSNRKKSCGHLNKKNDNIVNIGDKFGEWEVQQIINAGQVLCKCSCGVKKYVRKYDLINGKTKSCGHSSKGRGKNGRKDLTGTQIGEWSIGEYLGNGLYNCKCSCGTVKKLSGTYLRTGQSKSCGCKSNKFVDITGQKFGEWEVLEYCGGYKWKCKCSCGNIKEVYKSDLINGNSTNCGHKRTPNLINKKYSMLTPLEYLGKNTWKCRCDCGNIVNVFTNNLVNGSTKSCGCLKDLRESNLLNDIEDAINKYIEYNNKMPFTDDIAEMLGITNVTVKKYALKYELTEKLDKHFGSRTERDIYYMCKELSSDTESKNRSLISPLELDIYIPSKKLAIEFNGDFWHSAERLGKKYHQNKTIACAKKGVQLIHIFEHEWIDKNKRIKLEKLIESKLTKSKNIVYARNTEIKNVSDTDAKEFLDKYHLQNYTHAEISLGLYSNSELLSILTVGKPRFNNNYNYEIIRYCNKFDYGIVGGIEKLFKYFIKEYKPDSVITYSDISKFTGNVYTRIGFRPIQPYPITEPNYVWVNNLYDSVLHRYQTQKKQLLKLGLGTEEQSEVEIMKSNGYIQVFDCGSVKLEYIST